MAAPAAADAAAASAAAATEDSRGWAVDVRAVG